VWFVDGVAELGAAGVPVAQVVCSRGRSLWFYGDLFAFWRSLIFLVIVVFWRSLIFPIIVVLLGRSLVVFVDVAIVGGLWGLVGIIGSRFRVFIFILLIVVLVCVVVLVACIVVLVVVRVIDLGIKLIIW
jgi:hypothetical protein